MHQDVPFEQVVEAVQPERDLSLTPLFQVLFVLQNMPHASEQLEDLQLQNMGDMSGTAKYDLTLSLSETANGLAGTLEYSTDLFEAQTITRLLDHWQILLDGIVHNPQAPLWKLPLLTPEEYELQLEHWNATAMPAPQDRWVHQLFEQQVQRTPEAIALVCEDEALTYACLNERANQLAHYLQTLGVGPEVLVGICMERSIEMVLALLAALKAGGGYVPLDPTSPAERLAFMVQDAQISLLLIQQHLDGRISTLHTRVLVLEQVWEMVLCSPATPPVSRISPDHLAYVIYTSGSTGTPKGVQVTHQNLIHSTYDRMIYYPEAITGFLLLSPFFFDSSVAGIFWTLCEGGTLFVPQEGVVHDPVAIIEMIVRQHISHLLSLPSLYHLLLEHVQGSQLSSLRTVIVAGEICPPELLKQHRRICTDTLMYNEYGPTEGTVWSSVYQVQRDEPSLTVPIGRPIANVRIYILDRQQHLLPIGVQGELYIGGSGVARGYLHQPALTAERFIPDPFSTQGGGRLYRTGDLVRSMPDGTLDYIGRIDQQVKIRGYRIELGEVEAALRQHPAVQAVVVQAHEEVPGDKRLVAYIVSTEALAPSEWRAYLSKRLPEYMIPSAFVLLETLPLTSNGKLDRRALPAPELAKSGVAYVAPRTQQEAQLVQIWAQVLGREHVGIHDNFFELGGHSLLAMQVVARLRRGLGIDIGVRTLFEAPTVQALAAHLQPQMQQGQGISMLPIEVVTRSEELPLSYGQQRLWFLDQLEPGNRAYILPMALRLRGLLDRTALGRALEGVIRRHESLRTIFPSEQGKPVQWITSEPMTELVILDLSDLSVEKREQEAQRLAEQEVRRPFDLARGPLLRSWLLPLSKQDQILLLNMHHIITDGWSNEILVQELSMFYTALRNGEVVSLPPLSIQYADYALWQRSWLQGEVLQQQLNYWRQQLAAVAPLELPIDKPRPYLPTSLGAQQRITLPDALYPQVQALARREGVTPFMVLLAAWQVLLSRWSGQQDIAVGTPIANRGLEQVQELIGFFVNTLVLRTDLSGDPSLREVLQRIQHVALDAYAHQELPFERIVEELQPERALSRNPLFQVMFVFQNTSQPELKLKDLAVEVLSTPGQIAKFDLTLYVWETAEGLSGSFEYNIDLFDQATIARLATQFQRVLEALVERPEQQVSEVRLLSKPEREQILVQWNDTSCEYPQDACLHQLIEAQVARTPDAIAVVFEGEQLTYQQLNTRANHLASQLQEQGVQPETLVGFGVERSLELVVGLLGILKAGGAYVPLDPTYPQERLRALLEDADVSLVLTQSRFASCFLHEGVKLWCLDTMQWEELSEPRANPSCMVEPENVAYMIYTSGSTGQPKGVMVTHRGLINYVHWARQEYSSPQGRGAPLLSPMSFDLTVTSLFVPLLTGQPVEVLAEELGVEELMGALKCRPHWSLMKVTPAHLEALGTLELRGEIAESTGVLILGGEALKYKTLSLWRQRVPHCRLINEYGPTETVVGCCSYEVQQDDWGSTTVPIGRPIANTQLYVLSEQLQPVSIGVTGELYIAGAGLARGYWQRTDLTAERFVPDPFSLVGGGRIYRTGDLARYRADGVIEFLGRMDQQVKIRGYRIELGEIEVALHQHPAVQAAVVQAREEVSGDKRLVAYIVSTEALAPSEWRAYLSKRLPEYMIPSAFVLLETLPLTPNRKLDRRALPAPELTTSGVEYVAPRTPLEEQLAQIWAEVLRVERIGICDNFFELGGHSLLATQLMARLRQLFGVEIPLRVLFETPTVQELAARLQQELRHDRMLSMPPIVPVFRTRDMPLSYAQQRLWFLDQFEPGGTVYTIPGAVRLYGRLDRMALIRAFAGVILRHENLRTTFPSEQGNPVMHIVMNLNTGLVVLDLSMLSTEEREREVLRLAQQEAERPFDLACGPLLRGWLLQLDEQDQILLLNLHHIISDGWSNAILVRELIMLYAALRSGEAAMLPELPVQYADYASWQHQWLQGETLEALITYWTRQLRGATPLELPTDRPKLTPLSNRGAVHTFALSAGLSHDLSSLSRKEGVTLFMTLLTAFQILLHRYTKQQDIVVGTDVANRTHTELEGLIGFFVNLLVLRTQIHARETFEEVLKRVASTVLNAYSYQDLPFEKIVDALQLERVGYQTPLVNVLFVMQNDPLPSLNLLQDVTVVPLSVDNHTAKFDLAVFVAESEQGLTGFVNYRTALFDHETIEQLCDHFQILLQSIVTSPELAVKDLEIHSPQERAQQLDKKNSRHEAGRSKLKVARRDALRLSHTNTLQETD